MKELCTVPAQQRLVSVCERVKVRSDGELLQVQKPATKTGSSPRIRGRGKKHDILTNGIQPEGEALKPAKGVEVPTY